jgi:hypothetical protein
MATFLHYANAKPEIPQRHRSHTENGRKPIPNTDEEAIMQSVFEDETSQRPYAGPRSQHDRD